MLLLLVVVVAVRAARTQEPASPSRSTTTTTRERERRTADGAVLSRCPTLDQPAPLPALGCTMLSPPSVDDGERLPLVVLLHGFNTSPTQELGNGDWDAAVVRRRFLLMAPESNQGSWNVGGCCGLSQSFGVDDAGRLRRLLTAAKERPDVDPERIYLVGDSNGGMMVYRFLCNGAAEVAGAASIEGTRVAGCTPDAPVPIIHIAGLADMTVPYEGGQSLVSWVLGVSFPSVEKSISQLTTALDCTGPTDSGANAGKVRTREWSCAGGTPVRLVTLDGWGHAWPTPSWYRATDEVLDFFGIGV